MKSTGGSGAGGAGAGAGAGLGGGLAGAGAATGAGTGSNSGAAGGAAGGAEADFRLGFGRRLGAISFGSAATGLRECGFFVRAVAAVGAVGAAGASEGAEPLGVGASEQLASPAAATTPTVASRITREDTLTPYSRRA